MGWVDQSANRPGVIRPGEMGQVDFSCLIITVLISDAAEQIRMDLRLRGIPDEKIFFADAGMIG